ncbi:UDP-N-acetylglucosamine transferase subunit ALG13 homolog [Ceratina calcarata]|uniref:UDP-N-acetylglucosamine transferase subunit ALG13 n=1 Tax=Ceratina calcarata TaxID=156304 RepID=A0AAJ7IWD6_9HYME|nr:UDP-N-acetylglucosamine transferase subunit ALG13 homolog [Ceratina calcarata]
MIKKKIFVTVGTTKFDELIEKLLSREVLEALSMKGYNELVLQIGKTSLIPDCSPRYGFISIEYFNLSPDIIKYMQSADLIISHAGAGSILDALDNRKNLIVVANENLMDNHQMELGEQLFKERYLYYCTCDTLLRIIENINFSELRTFVDLKSRAIAQYIDEIMGF